MLEKNYKFISPNFGERPAGVNINTLVIHYTDMADDISALERLCNPLAEVSSHYLINKQGIIFSLVPDHLCAWHAGPSCWRDKEKVNDFSIGIELDNNGKEPFSDALMHSLIKLCHELMQIHPIEQRNVVGHSDIIPSRKFDPGRFFNWQLLSEHKIGLYPKTIQEQKLPPIYITQNMLKKFGYKIEITGKYDDLTKDVMRAFNEHFNRECFDVWNKKSQGVLESLIKICC